MSKIKKIFISLGAFFAMMFTKICGLISNAEIVPQPLYGVPQDLYGPPQLTTVEKISKIVKPAIWVVVFIIGLIVILSKKISKKAKVIVVSLLILLAMLGYAIMNYIEVNF